MRVTFFSSGGLMEEGVDQGGLTKEFFQLITRALFNEVCCTRLPLTPSAAGGLTCRGQQGPLSGRDAVRGLL